MRNETKDLVSGTDCGSPELPPGSVIEESDGERMTVSCTEGLHLNEEADPAGDNVTTLICNNGAWNSTNLKCRCKFKLLSQ